MGHDKKGSAAGPFVDDSARPEERTKTGLTDALDAVLANREVTTASTRAFGCTIKWKS